MHLSTFLLVSFIFSPFVFGGKPAEPGGNGKKKDKDNSGTDCVWDKSDFPNYPPMLINFVDWLAYLPVLENDVKVVRIEENTAVTVACPGELLSIGVEVAEGICQAGSLVINGSPYHISDLGCDRRVDDATVIYSGRTCADGTGTLNGIGFNVTGHQFYQTIELCFDTDAKLTRYATHLVYGNSVDAADTNPSRPSFKMSNGFYDSNPNNCYLTANQDEYFEMLLSDPDYIDFDNQHYFSRGHLAPNGAFFVEMEADATFYYINTIPQWQIYNAQNWAYVEKAVRDIASLHGTNLQVSTGPYGQLILSGKPIFHCASQGRDTIPTPELIWKIVYEVETNRGLAIVTSNIPHEKMPSMICSDLDCTTISWVNERVPYPTSLSRGYTYCCAIQDLKASVYGLPGYPADVGILM